MKHAEKLWRLNQRKTLREKNAVRSYIVLKSKDATTSIQY